MKIQGYAAQVAGEPLSLFEYDPGPLSPDEVEIAVEYCGLCHSDLSMIENAWEISEYPFIPGHEVIGTIAGVGERVTELAMGQRVGLGWRARSCLVCDQCTEGRHNRCMNVESGGDTIVGRHGGFADRVRCQSRWAFPIPEGVAPQSAGPLFCGGVTVFSPIEEYGIRPTDRVGVVGIGGLGHMALGFLNAWGCDATAFSTSPEKADEARTLGAHHFINSRDPAAIESAANRFDMVLVTVNVPLDWDALIGALRPGGRLHIVGAIARFEADWFPVIFKQVSISGSPTGRPATITRMLEFCARHTIAPMVEEFPLSKVNDALDHLRSGKARYRIVLRNDF